MAYSVYKLKTIVIQKGIKINMKNQKNYRIQDNMKNNQKFRFSFKMCLFQKNKTKQNNNNKSKKNQKNIQNTTVSYNVILKLTL